MSLHYASPILLRKNNQIGIDPEFEEIAYLNRATISYCIHCYRIQISLSPIHQKEELRFSRSHKRGCDRVLQEESISWESIFSIVYYAGLALE